MSEEATIAHLIRSGALIPVQVFGACGHPVTFDNGKTDTCEDGDHWSYGLSDRFSEHSPAGSDCNRAVEFVVRPSDEMMGTAAVRDALSDVVQAGEAMYRTDGLDTVLGP